MEGPYPQVHHEISYTLDQRKENLDSLNKRIERMEAIQQQQHEKIRAALKDEEKEIKGLMKRNSPSNIDTLETLKKSFTQHHQRLRSALDQETENLVSVKQSFQQLINIQQQQHHLIRSTLEEELNQLRSRQTNNSIWLSISQSIQLFTCALFGTQNQNNRTTDCQNQHHEIRSALDKENVNLKSLEKSVKQIEEIQKEERHHFRSTFEPDGKQQRMKRMDDFEKHIKLRSYLNDKEEKVKLLVKLLEEIQKSSHPQNEVVRFPLEQREDDQRLPRPRIIDAEREYQRMGSPLKEKENQVLERRILEREANEQKQQQLRSNLRKKEKETEGLQHKIIEMDRRLQTARLNLKEEQKKNEALKQRINDAEGQCIKMRSDLKEKEQQNEDLERRINDAEGQCIKIRSDLKEKERQNEALERRINDAEGNYQRISSDLYNKKDENAKLIQMYSTLQNSIQHFEALHKQQHHKAESALKEMIKENEDLKQRIQEMVIQQKQHHSRIHEMEAQLQSTRSSLKYRERENEELKKRIQELETNEQKQQQLRFHLQDKEKETEGLQQKINEIDKQLQTASYTLAEKEKQIEALQKRLTLKEQKENEALQQQRENEELKRRINDAEGNYQRIRSALKEKQQQNEALERSINEMKLQVQRTSSDLYNKKDENAKLIQSIQHFEALIKQQHHKAESALKEMIKENEHLKQRIQEMVIQQKQHHSRPSLKFKEQESEALKQKIHEMEAQLQSTRSALKEKDEELKSFKDRVAGDVALSIKTGKTMSLNNPVNKTRLKEMYDSLRCDWPKIKDSLKSNQTHPDSAKELIQTKFRDAKTEMIQRKMLVDKVYETNVKNAPRAPQKVDQYRQLTIQNLQLTLYNERQGASLQRTFPGGNPQEVWEYLGSECYWLGCLMALSNPPLRPDWENHPPSMDKWDLLPRNITTVSLNE